MRRVAMMLTAAGVGCGLHAAHAAVGVWVVERVCQATADYGATVMCAAVIAGG